MGLQFRYFAVLRKLEYLASLFRAPLWSRVVALVWVPAMDQIFALKGQTDLFSSAR